MAINKEQIAAALQKLGPSTPDALCKELGCERHALQYHLKAMLADKSVKQAGNRRTRIIALPDQKLEAPPTNRPTPPQPHKRKKGRGKSAARSAPAPRAAAAEFLPAFTTDARLVIVNGSQSPQIFSPEHTESIATLLANYFKA